MVTKNYRKYISIGDFKKFHLSKINKTLDTHFMMLTIKEYIPLNQFGTIHLITLAMNQGYRAL